jgi:UDP-N-acetylmuramoyl-L-alanyl-D-glutamate--2,6-diaminopimelate ligase
MQLKELLRNVPVKLPEAFLESEVADVFDDSRRVTPGSLFAAVSGPQAKGEDFIPQAVEKGARFVVLGDKVRGDYEARYPDVSFIRVPDPRGAFRSIVDVYYGRPSQNVRVLGITGTNGKTTITYFLEAILKAAGQECGVVGTVNCRVAGDILPSKNTTPGFLDNQIFLRGLADRNIRYSVMEVSSHALDQGRVDLIGFRGAVFTNLTGDHLDYHKTMEDYFQAKAKLFSGLAPDAFAVINVDDEYGRRLLQMTKARVITYGIKNPADIKAEVQDLGLKGSRFTVTFPGGKLFLKTDFIGLHNVYNILAACAAGLEEGISPEKVKKGIESLHHVPGRLERVDAGQDFYLFIDYAHTDDGLKNVLESLRAVRHKRLIVVFGCGGDRDRTKRPRMGRVACDLADHVILTSDNPRSEDPDDIIAEIIPGFSKCIYEVVVDREAAIERALAIARPGDIVLLAGKGHETYQILKHTTIDFVERDIVMRILKEKAVQV